VVSYAWLVMHEIFKSFHLALDSRIHKTAYCLNFSVLYVLVKLNKAINKQLCDYRIFQKNM